MKNKINWRYLLRSLITSIVLGCLFTIYLHLVVDKSNLVVDNKLLSEWIVNSLTFMALPSLVVSCMVIIKVEDVRRQIEARIEYNSLLSNFENNAKVTFFNGFADDNCGFLVNYKELIKDIRIILSQKIGDNYSEVVKRMIESAYLCSEYIDEFTYVDAHIKIKEKAKYSVEKNENDDFEKENVYLSFAEEDKDTLVRLLKELYTTQNKDCDPLKILSIEKYEKLRNLLNRYSEICRILFETISRENSSFTGVIQDTIDFKNKNDEDKEERYDE